MRDAFGARFDVPAGYCNTASIGIPSQAMAAAVADSVARWGRGADSPTDFEPLVDASRQGFADLLGVPADWVTQGAAAAQLVAPVAASLSRLTGRDRPRVLVPEGEFTSAVYPFVAQGHDVTQAPLARLADAVDGHDLVATSVVQSADGARVDLPALRAATSASGARVLLDVTQAAGWLPLRTAPESTAPESLVGWADFVVAAGYKWLMCPRGVAWLAVRPELADALTHLHANWYAGADRWADSLYGLPMRLDRGARGLDVSPVWLAHVGAAAAFDWWRHAEVGAIAEHDVSLANRLRSGCELAEGDSAIVSVASSVDPQRLTDAGIRFASRAGRLRFAFHLYNTADDVDLVLQTLR